MEIAIKIITAVVGVVATTLCAWFGAQIKKYKKLAKTEEDRAIKKTITNVITTKLQPVCDEISELKDNISQLQNVDTNFSTRLQPLQEEIEVMKDDITEILLELEDQSVMIKNLEKKENNLEKQTKCSWRYRIRTLCHAYISRGYMTHDEFSQLQEMFALYEALGGNGQTKELYERTMKLEIK